MALLPEWETILKQAWSVRLAVLSGALSALEVVLPLFVDSMPRGVFSGISVLVAMAIPVVRIVAQPKKIRGGR